MSSSSAQHVRRQRSIRTRVRRVKRAAKTRRTFVHDYRRTLALDPFILRTCKVVRNIGWRRGGNGGHGRDERSSNGERDSVTRDELRDVAREAAGGYLGRDKVT